MSCTSCVYYQPPAEDAVGVIGECRRYPPAQRSEYGHGHKSLFPRVDASMACGEFKGRLVGEDTVTVYKASGVGRSEMYPGPASVLIPTPICVRCGDKGYYWREGREYDRDPVQTGWRRCVRNCKASLLVTSAELADLNQPPGAAVTKPGSIVRLVDRVKLTPAGEEGKPS